MSKPNELLECFYCGIEIPRARLEFDHFPIPSHCGGNIVVPACVVCHDLKDRLRLDQLPEEFLAQFVRDFVHLSRHTRIVLAKMLAIGQSDAQLKSGGETESIKHRNHGSAVIAHTHTALLTMLTDDTGATG